MHLAIIIWAILASWHWGDWKHIHTYHPTMLYMSSMNLLYFFLTAGYPLWRLQPDLGVPETMMTLLYTFIVFPCTVILFLSHYPDTLERQILHVGKWVAIYLGIEWIGGEVGRVTYQHGWNLGWSFLFLIVMFPMLSLHFKKPPVAYVLSIVVIVLLIYLFDIPWAISLEERL